MVKTYPKKATGQNITSVAISPLRLNGLEYKAQVESYRRGYSVSKRALLDRILAKAKVPELNDEQLAEKTGRIAI